MPKLESKEREVDRIEYLLERNKRGKFLYSNFQAVRNVGVRPYKKIKSVRPELGDYDHIASPALHIFSFLYLSPRFAYDIYRCGKIVGYCTIDGLLKTLRMRSLVNSLAKTGVLSKVFQNERVQEALRKGWQGDGGALVELIEVDKEKKRLKYAMRENSCAIIKTLNDRYHYEYPSKPSGCIEVGVLCGQVEALFGGLWDGVETKCSTNSDPYCEMELELNEEEMSPRISVLTKEEYGRILEMGVDFIVSKERDTERKEIGDLIMIAVSQSINYLLLSTSRGHIVLSKWAGRKVGELIIKKVKKNNLFDALECLKDVFLYLKMGIIEYEPSPEIIVVKMRESTYSSGVRNINMKLCIFIAGIIEGVLTKATKMEWIVTETKCTANGDPYCEFECVTKDPNELKRMLLGE